jgi:[protein-PII] uridylyltransferase
MTSPKTINPKSIPDTMPSPSHVTRIDGLELRYRLSSAAEQSNGQTNDLRARAVGILKECLTVGRAYILKHHLEIPNGKTLPSGLGTARQLAELTDQIVSALWDYTLTHVYRARNPTEGERLSLVAVGGYGRGELAPHSDIDLLFLRAWKQTPHGESVIEFILYTLWDLGFKVGYASRSIDDCLRLALEDHTIMAALLENRLIAGDRELHDALRASISPEQLKPNIGPFIAAKLSERESRHDRAGTSRYLVEPNLKEGRGGLRDLQSLYWIAHYLTMAGEAGPSGNILNGLLTPKEQALFDKAFEFFWRVRILLHNLAGRAEERLHFDLQPELARRMGFVSPQGEPLVERFMRRYFHTAREVGTLTRIVCTQLEDQKSKPQPSLNRLWQSAKGALLRPDHPGFVIEGHRLSVRYEGIFELEPHLMMAFFANIDRLELDLHPKAFTAISRKIGLMDAKLRRSSEQADIFLRLLSKGKNPYRILSLMSETGLLGRYLPEYGRIVAQTQLNMYHAYTVDEHTLKALDIIHGIDTGRYKNEHPLATQLIKQVIDKDSLYLAMLLHDTGKGDDLGQEIAGEISARKACTRLGLAAWQIDQVGWLVRHHLVLSDFAQKRDIHDPDTIRNFAEIVQTPERLRLLLILTVADIRAVGPTVWNAWKGQLMRDLVAATEAHFRGGRDNAILSQTDQANNQALTQLRKSILDKTPKPEKVTMETLVMRAQWPLLSQNTYEDLKQLAQHYAQLAPNEAKAWYRIDEQKNAAIITILGPDRRGLFADLSQTLAVFGANVLGASAHTLDHDRAIDVFSVQDISGQAFGKTHTHTMDKLLQALMKSSLDSSQSSEPLPISRAKIRAIDVTIAATVLFENTPQATIIEVSGRDRPGLLAGLARAIDNNALSIGSAHIDCYGHRAVDAFYVFDQETRKPLNADQKKALKADILAVLDEGHAMQIKVSPLTLKTATKR